MSSMPTKPVLAAIQEPPVFLNKTESIRRAIDAIERAAKGGADIIGFSECWIPGYPVWLDFAPKAAVWDEPGAKALYRLLRDNSVTADDSLISEIQKVVNRTKTHVVLGTHERHGETLYNTGWLFAPHMDPKPHRKLVPTYTERLVWGRGDGSTLASIESPFGTIGSLICWEHWMPFARAAMHAKNEAVHIAQWPVVKEMHQINSRHYAFEGRSFVIAAGSILTKRDILDGFRSLGVDSHAALALLESMPGNPDDFIHNGGSAIIGPDGAYIADPVFDRSAIVMAEADLDKISEESQTLDITGHYSRPDIFSLEINTAPQSGVKYID